MADLSYDDKGPFELTIESVLERPGVVIAECRFESAEGEPVAGYLVTRPIGRRQRT